MTHVTRCDAGQSEATHHDMQRGQRYLDILVRNSAKGTVAFRQLCADHAREEGARYVEMVFDADFAEITAEWKEVF